MNQGKIVITAFDKKRLEQMISSHLHAHNPDVEYLMDLSEELNRAEIVLPEDIPRDVVTMNSRVTICDADTKEVETYSLVFPAGANISQNKISILSPVGTALIGCRVGYLVEWKVPAGLRKLEVKKIEYQPEAAGDYHL
jgi:regulator of nucleoside diphosphate kinase